MNKELNTQILDRRRFVMSGLYVSAASSLLVASRRTLAQAAPDGSKTAVDAAKAPPAGTTPTVEIEPSKLLPDNNPMVIALKYSHDATKAEMRKAPRQGVEAKDQTCSSCQLYKAAGVLKGTKEEVGICQMIPGGHVKALGWCNSWVKKA